MMKRLAVVLVLLLIAWTLMLVALGFGGVALFALLRWYMSAPAAALATSAAFVLVALVVLVGARRPAPKVQKQTGPVPARVIRAYPLETTSLAFVIGFLIARSRDTTMAFASRLLSLLLRPH